MNSDKLNVIRQPACRHLLSKGMFVTGTLDPEVEDVERMSDGNCWCNQTQHVLGPDSKIVEREACVATRACYEARF